MKNFEKLIEEYRSMQLAKSHFNKLTVRLDKEQVLFDELTIILNKEYKDVQKFERLSLNSLFSKFLGNNEQQYEIEKQEYLLAFLKYDESKKVIKLLEFERNVLEEKLNNETSIKNKLNDIIEQNDNLISTKYPELRNPFIEINKKLKNNIAFRSELREAIIVSLKIEDIFTKMIEYLNQAKLFENWGTFYREIQEGKKKKKSYLDQAQQLSYIAKQFLQQLEDELEDVYKFISINRMTQFEELQHFNDIYYDRLISDWIIKHEISSSLNCLIGTKNSIERILVTLKVQLEKTEKNINNLIKQRKELLVKNIT